MDPRPVEKEIAAALLAAPGLAARVEGKIYGGRIPQGTQLPCVSFHRISGRPLAHLLGYQASLVRVQIDIWAKEYGQANEIALEVGRAMNQAWFANWPAESRDSSEEHYFRVSLEFTCKQSGGFLK